MSLTLTNIETAIGSIGRLSASAPVQIGSLVLTGMEVPDRIRDGGQQQVVVHRLPGGGRVLDAIGNDPSRLELEGRFLGPTAFARAQMLKQMRIAGKPISFSGAGLKLTVKIAEFSCDYQQKGVVIPYRLALEQPDQQPPTAKSASTSGLSSLIGKDAASAVNSVTSAVTHVATVASNIVGQMGSIVGQITPIADMIGVGGVFSKIQGDLSVANGLTGAAVNLASVPESAASVVSSLESAGSGLMTTIGQTGANLESVVMNGAAGLSTLTQNAELHTTSAQSGALVNRAYANTITATGGTQNGPLVVV